MLARGTADDATPAERNRAIVIAVAAGVALLVVVPILCLLAYMFLTA